MTNPLAHTLLPPTPRESRAVSLMSYNYKNHQRGLSRVYPDQRSAAYDRLMQRTAECFSLLFITYDQQGMNSPRSKLRGIFFT